MLAASSKDASSSIFWPGRTVTVCLPALLAVYLAAADGARGSIVMVLSGPLTMAASDAVITLTAFSASFRLGTVFYSRFLCRESEPRQYVAWWSLLVVAFLILAFRFRDPLYGCVYAVTMLERIA